MANNNNSKFRVVGQLNIKDITGTGVPKFRVSNTPSGDNKFNLFDKKRSETLLSAQTVKNGKLTVDKNKIALANGFANATEMQTYKNEHPKIFEAMDGVKYIPPNSDLSKAPYATAYDSEYAKTLSNKAFHNMVEDFKNADMNCVQEIIDMLKTGEWQDKETMEKYSNMFNKYTNSYIALSETGYLNHIPEKDRKSDIENLTATNSVLSDLKEYFARFSDKYDYKKKVTWLNMTWAQLQDERIKMTSAGDNEGVTAIDKLMSGYDQDNWDYFYNLRNASEKEQLETVRTIKVDAETYKNYLNLIKDKKEYIKSMANNSNPDYISHNEWYYNTYKTYNGAKEDFIGRSMEDTDEYIAFIKNWCKEKGLTSNMDKADWQQAVTEARKAYDIKKGYIENGVASRKQEKNIALLDWAERAAFYEIKYGSGDTLLKRYEPTLEFWNNTKDGESLSNYYNKMKEDSKASQHIGEGKKIYPKKNKYISDTEYEIACYYLGKGEKNNYYFKWLADVVNRREVASKKGWGAANNVELLNKHRLIADFTKQNPVTADLLSVGLNIGGGVEWTYNTLSGNVGTESKLAKAATGIREVRSDQIDWEIGRWDAFDFLYGTGMSALDSIAANALGGKAGSVILGLSAAAQATNDALERGMSNEKAFWSGFMSGVFEMFFEKCSIEQWHVLAQSSGAGFKTAIKNIGRSMITNASEETLTELANIAYDIVCNGDFSQYAMSIKKYTNMGLTEKEAKHKSALELGIGVAEAAGSGALMGLGFGSTGATSASYNATQYGKIHYGSSKNSIYALVNNGLAMPQDSTAYNLAVKADTRLKNGKSLSGTTLYNLADSIKSEIETKSKSRFQELGVDKKTTKALSPIVAKAVFGENLTQQEQETLNSYEIAAQVVEEMSADKTNTIWKDAIKNNSVNFSVSSNKNTILHSESNDNIINNVGDDYVDEKENAKDIEKISQVDVFSNVSGESHRIDNESYENKALNELELADVLKYKSSASYLINDLLRNSENLSDVEAEFVRNMDDALIKMPTYQGTVYRNIAFDWFGGQEAYDAFLSEHKVGYVVNYLAFTSASIKEDGYLVDGRFAVSMVIESGNAKNVDGYGNNFESEVMFPRNSVFVVNNVKYNDKGQPIIYMTEVIKNDEGKHGQFYSKERSEVVQSLSKSQPRYSDLQDISEDNTTRCYDRKNYLQSVSEEERGLKEFDYEEIEKLKENFEDRVESRLLELGVDKKTANSLSPIVAKAVFGENLTQQEQETLNSYEIAAQVAKELSADKANTIWKDAIKNGHINNDTTDNSVTEQGDILQSTADSVVDSDIATTQYTANSKLQSNKNNNIINSVGDIYVDEETNSEGVRKIREKYFRKIGDDFQGGISETAETFSERTRRNSLEGSGKERLLLNEGKLIIAYTPVKDDNSPKNIFFKKLRERGIDIYYCDGVIETNVDGITLVHNQAITTRGGKIFVSNVATVEFKSMMDHELVHWKMRMFSDSYFEYEDIVLRNLNRESNYYIAFCEELNLREYNNRYDINTIEGAIALNSEITAYVYQYVLNNSNFAENFFSKMFFDWHNVKNAVKRFNSKMEINTELFNQVGSYDESAFFAYKNKIENNTTEQGDVLQSTADGVVDSDSVAEVGDVQSDSNGVASPGVVQGADGKQYFDDDSGDEHFGEHEISYLSESDVISSFDIKRMNDTIHVQEKVFETLLDEGFFEDFNERKTLVKNKSSGMIIEINKSGIRETFNYHNFTQMPHEIMMDKLLLIRNLPLIIRNGKIIEDNVKNIHSPKTSVSYAYIVQTVRINGVEKVATVVIRKSPQKNKFWTLQIDIKNNIGSTPAGISQNSITGLLTSNVNDSLSQKFKFVNIGNNFDGSGDEYFGDTSGDDVTHGGDTSAVSEVIDGENAMDLQLSEPALKDIARAPTAEEAIEEAITGKQKTNIQRHIVDICKKLFPNITVEFVDKIDEKGKINGKFIRSQNKILIKSNLNAVQMYIEVFKHEFMHRLETKRLYSKFFNFCFKKSKAFEQYVRAELKSAGVDFNVDTATRDGALEAYTKYKFNQYKNSRDIPKTDREAFTMENAKEEIVADFFAQILFQGKKYRARIIEALENADGEALIGIGDEVSSEAALMELKQKEPTLLEQVIEWFKDVINRLRGLPQAKSLVEQLDDEINLLESMARRAYQSKDSKRLIRDKKGEVKYILVGKTVDGTKIYKTNYPPNTPKSIKQADLISLIQNVWCKNPITLDIVKDGVLHKITVRFNPELSERSDLAKIAFGNKKGNASDQRITLDLASDLYQIAADSRYLYSKDAVPKPQNPAHDDVSKYHYFITNIVYKDSEDNYINCHINIDIKQNTKGNWFYSFGIEKGSAPQTLLAAVTDDSATLPTSSISHIMQNVNSKDSKRLMKKKLDEIKFSLMNNNTFESNVDIVSNMNDADALQNKEEGNFVRVMYGTPAIVRDNVADAENLDVIISFYSLYLAIRKNGVLEGHYHNLGSEIIKKLPEYISNPDAIVRTNNGRLNLFTQIETPKGNNGILSIELNTVKDINNQYDKYNLVVTVFSAGDNYTRNNIIKNVIKVEYKKENLLQVNPQLYEWLTIVNNKSSLSNINEKELVVNSKDAKLKSLHITSAYINKKDTFSDVLVSEDPKRYVQDEHQPNVSSNSITHTTRKVKETSETYRSKDSKRLIRKKQNEIKCKIMSFDDGVKYVDITIDQERFEGLTTDEMQKEAKRVIKENFVGKVIGINNRVFVNSRSAGEYSYPSKFIKNSDITEVKMRASTELDNLVEIGSNHRNKPDGLYGHIHAKAVGGFDYYDTIFKVGNKYYFGIINIMITDRGRLLKDITQIRDISNDIIAQYGENPQGEFVENVSEKSISDFDKNVNAEKSNDQQTQVEGLKNNVEQNKEATSKDEVAFSMPRDYSYEALISKPDIEITEIDSFNGKINNDTRKVIIDKAVENAAAIGRKNENGNAVIYVKDIDTEIILSKSGLRHGLDRRFELLAPVLLKSGEILKNSIRINELIPRVDDISKSYVLIGVAKNMKNEPYIISFVVNKVTSEVSAVDVLYAINAKTEPAGSLSPSVPAKEADYFTDSTISISELLDYVNKYFPDILPESVLRHYGYEARPDGKIGESALFSIPIGKRKNTVKNNVIELSKSNELSKRIGDSHGNAKYKIIQQYILDVLNGKQIVLSDGKIAVVDKNDAKYIASNSGSKKTAEISQIKEIIEKALLVAEEKSKKERKFEHFYYYEATVKYDGEIFNIYLNVGRASNDQSYHLYDITQKLRETAHRVNDVGRPPKSEGDALKNGISNDSITKNTDVVNNNYSTKTDILDELLDNKTNNIDKSDDYKFSISKTKNMDWIHQIYGLYNKNGQIIRSDTLVVETETPLYLRLDGIKNLPLAIPLSVVTKATNGKDRSHSIKQENIIKLQNGIRNADIVIKNPERNSFVFLTNIKQDGYPVLISFLQDVDFDGDRVHKATSIHLQIDVNSMLEALPSDATVYLKNKNEFNDTVGVTNNLRSLAANIEFIDEILSQNGGVVNNNYSTNVDMFDGLKELNVREKEYIQRVCNQLGRQVVFEDLREMKYKGEILSPDGYIGSDGVIHINTYAENPIGFILKHELTHFGEKSSRYIEFVKTVKKSAAYKKWITEKIGESDLRIAEYKYKQAVANAHGDIYGAADPKAEAETIADFVGDMLFTENGSGMAALTSDLDTKQRNAVIQFVLDFISFLKKKLSGIDAMTFELSRMEDRFNELLSDAKNNDSIYDNEVCFCFGVTQEDINNYVDSAYSKENTEDYKKYAIPTQRLINDVADEIDISDYSHALRDNDIRHIKNSHGENTNEKYPVTSGDIKLIPWIVQNYDKVFVKTNSRGKLGLLYVKVAEENVIYYVEAVTEEYHNEKLLVNKQMIKTGISDIPNLYGLYNAINKKMSSSQYLADLNEIRKAYVQDVKENYSNFIIPNSFGNVNIEGNNGASLDQYSLSSPLQEFKNNNEFELSEPDIDNIEISDEVEFLVGLNGFKLNKVQKHIVDICKKLHSNVTVEFVNKPEGNGKFIRSQNKILIKSDLNAVQMYVEVFKHEFMHRLETKALYSKFFNYCFKKSKAFEQYVIAKTKLINNNVDDMARESVLNLYTEYKYNQYINDKNIPSEDRDAFTMENAQEEIIADFFAQILFQGKEYRARIIEALENADGEALIGIGDEISSEAALMELQQKEPTLLEQVIEWFKDVINRLRGLPQAKSLVEQLDNELDYLESMARRAYLSKDSKRLVKKKLNEEKYLIAGEKSQTANHSLLFEAKLRDYKGEDSESIRRDTGWYKGRDGKWRYYIPDNELNIDQLIDFANSDEDVALLGDVIVHNKLFAAYPTIRNVVIQFKDIGPTKKGEFLSNKNEIIINIKLKDDVEKIKNTLVHEIQHAIQYIEGFALGGNKYSGFVYAMNIAYDEAKNTSEFNMLKTKEEKYYYLLSAAQRIFDAENPDELPYKAYRAIYGEVEARQVTRNRLFDEELLRFATPDVSGNVVDVTDESIKFIENFTEMGYTEKEIVNFFGGEQDDESRSVGNIEKRSGIDRAKSNERLGKPNIFSSKRRTYVIRRMDEGGTRNYGEGVQSNTPAVGGISGRGSSVDSDIIDEKNMGVRGVNQKTGFYYAINTAYDMVSRSKEFNSLATKEEKFDYLCNIALKLFDANSLEELVYKAYLNIYGEVEARQVEQYRDYDENLLKLVEPDASDIIIDNIIEKNKAIKNLTEMGYNESEARKIVKSTEKSNDQQRQVEGLENNVNQNKEATSKDEVAFSMPRGSRQNSIKKYTEEQYNNFGWVRYNEVLTAQEYSTLLSRYADYKHNENSYPTTRFGEAVIHSSECPDVLMYVKGKIGNPQITKIVRINADEYNASVVKEEILHYEYRHLSLPYQNVKNIYGEGILDISKKRDFVSFQEYRSKQERGFGKTNSSDDRANQDGRGSSGENTGISEADSINESAFSMPQDYLYEALINKPDMMVTILDDNDIPNNRVDLVTAAKKNAAAIGKANNDGSISVYVEDIGKEIVIGKKGLVHGLDRRLSENAKATLRAGEIIKNSIKINELTPAKQEADESYVLIGAAIDDGKLNIVRFVVNRFSNELLSMDVLYAINTKKESTAVLNAPLASTPDYRTTISISKLLDYVNKYFPDILPESVLRHYGYEARPEGKIGESALFSLPIGKRRKAVKNNVIELSKNNELSKQIGDLRGAAKYKVIQQYILDVLSGEEVVLSDGKIAVVDKSDALHIANKAANKKTAQISSIRKIVERAILVAEEESTKERKFDHFYYYEATVKYDEETFNVYLDVGRARNNGTYHIYDITNKIRDTANRINGLERPKPNEGYALTNGISNDSITKNTDVVNNNYSTNTDNIEYVALNEKEQGYIKKICNKFGISIVFEDLREMVHKGEILSPDGYIDKDKGIIHLNLYAENPIGFILKHELTHFGEKSSRYIEFVKTVKKSAAYKKWITEKTGESDLKIAEYKYKQAVASAHSDIYGAADPKADAEMIADFVGEMLFTENGSGMAALTSDLDTKQRNAVIQFVLDFISFLKKKLNGIDAMTFELSRLEDRFNELLSDAKNNDSIYDNEVKFSIKQSFYTQLDNWDKETIGFSFVVGTTSDALLSAGVPNKQIRWDASKIRTLLNKHIGMDIEIVRQIPNLLENPIVVIDSKQNHNSRIVMGELSDNNGKLVTVVILLTPTSKKGNQLDVIKISSAQGRGHIESLFKKDDGGFVKIWYIDKERIQSWLNVNRLQLPLHSFNLDSNSIVSNFSTKVNENNDGFNKLLSDAKNNDSIYDNEVCFCFGVTQEDINNYVDSAYSKENTEDYKKYAVPTQRLINDVADEIDISDYSHALRDNDIRHIKNSHGEETNEKYPVTSSDIKLIPWIVQNYDKVFVVNRDDNRTGLIYVKVNEKGLLYFLEQVTTIYGNEPLLVNKQMIKTGIDDIPNLKGLIDAINKKQSKIEFLADLKKVHEVYAQSVNQSYFNSSITKIGDEVNNISATNTDTFDDVRFSLKIKHADSTVEEIKDARNLTDEQAIEYLKQAKRGELRRETYIPIRKDTPATIIDTLSAIGIEVQDRSLIMQVRKAQQAMLATNNGLKSKKQGNNLRSHGMSAEQIVEIVNNLDNPTAVILQTNRYNQYGDELPDNVAVFVEYNNSGKEGVAIVEFDSSIDPQFIGEEYGDTDYHTVVTIFEPDTERSGMPFDYIEELLSNPDNYELEIVRRQPARSATGEKHPNTSSELPSPDIISAENDNVKYDGRQPARSAIGKKRPNTSSELPSSDIIFDDLDNVNNNDSTKTDAFNELKQEKQNNEDIRFVLNKKVAQSMIDDNVVKVVTMNSVADLTGEEFEKGPVDLVTQVEKYFNSIGNIVKSKYGDVELTRVGIKSSLGHGIGRKKAAAFKAVPNTIKYGEIINYQKNWKNRGYDTVIFAAPITINGKRHFLAVVINVEIDKNSYYLHEVALQEVESNTSFKTGTVKNGTPGDALPSIYNLLQKLQVVNNNYSTNADMFKGLGELNVRDKAEIESVCNELGRKVVFEDLRDMVYNGETISPDGYIDADNLIHINTYAENPLGFVFKHELTHYAEKSDGYDAFVNAVKNSSIYAEWIKSKTGKEYSWDAEDTYRQMVYNSQSKFNSINDTRIDNEIIADFVGEMLFTDNGSGMLAIAVESAPKQRNVIVQWVLKFIAYIKRTLGIGKSNFGLEISVLEDSFKCLLNDSVSNGEQQHTDDIQFCFVRCTDKQKIAAAEQMEKQGAKQYKIWDELKIIRNGWGDWLSEVNTYHFSFFAKGTASVEKGRSNPNVRIEENIVEGKLGDFVGFKSLFNIYPQLKKVKVVIKYAATDYDTAKYLIDSNKLLINKKLYDAFVTKNDQTIKMHLVRELQRMIQVVEGRVIDSNLKNIERLRVLGFPESRTEDRQLTENEIRNSFADEYEARVAEKRQRARNSIFHNFRKNLNYLNNQVLYEPYFNYDSILLFDDNDKLITAKEYDVINENHRLDAYPSMVYDTKRDVTSLVSGADYVDVYPITPQDERQLIEQATTQNSEKMPYYLTDLFYKKKTKRKKVDNRIRAGNSGCLENNGDGKNKFETVKSTLYHNAMIEASGSDTAGRALSSLLTRQLNNNAFKDSNGNILSFYLWNNKPAKIERFVKLGKTFTTFDNVLDEFFYEKTRKSHPYHGIFEEFYIDSVCPLILEMSEWNTAAVAELLLKNGEISKNYYDELLKSKTAKKSEFNNASARSLTERIKLLGYDSVVLVGDSGCNVMVFDASQVIPVAQKGIVCNSEINQLQEDVKNEKEISSVSFTVINEISVSKVNVSATKKQLISCSNNTEKLIKLTEILTGVGNIEHPVLQQARVGSSGVLENTGGKRLEIYSKYKLLKTRGTLPVSDYDTAGREVNPQIKLKNSSTIFKDNDGRLLSLFAFKGWFRQEGLGVRLGTLNSAREIYKDQKARHPKLIDYQYQEYYVNMCNPYVWYRSASDTTPAKIANSLFAEGKITFDEYSRLLATEGAKTTSPKSSAALYLKSTLLRHGYDGVICMDNTYDIGSITVFALKPEQLTPVTVNGDSVENINVEKNKKVFIDYIDNKEYNKKKKKYLNRRPSYGKNQLLAVWNFAKKLGGGKVIDPTGKEIVWDTSKARNGQWDMGHIPGQKYSEMHKKYLNDEITEEEFVNWYRDPKNYRPELPSTNRSHKYE